MQDSINIQREKIQKGNPTIEISGACRVGQGIIRMDNDMMTKASEKFDIHRNERDICFFIPASGSGSRMFGFLFQYLNEKNPTTATITALENFVQRIDDFAFYDLIDSETANALTNGSADVRSFVRTLLTEEPFNYGHKPKGMIPFHRSNGSSLNPFQEHLLHSVKISGNKCKFHFTVNPDFKEEISSMIEEFKKEHNLEIDVELSTQNHETDSVAFGENMTPIKNEQGKNVYRPSGHGALLYNLNNVESDLIFIRNIDNIQHQNKGEKSIEYRKSLAGELLSVQELIHSTIRKIENSEDVTEEVQELNERYGLGLPIDTIASSERLFEHLNRPIRVCGMVKNEGQPGGGPFWVRDSNGNISRQIIEKAQISKKDNQIDHLLKATHFNPVEVVCAVKDYKGNKFDLMNYRNNDLYFIVNKTHEGQAIKYIEQPGLWNGSMENWITLFYEIDSACFTGVKTVLDLLSDAHQA